VVWRVCVVSIEWYGGVCEWYGVCGREGVCVWVVLSEVTTEWYRGRVLVVLRGMCVGSAVCVCVWVVCRECVSG
jgi:hypothetical protein